MNNQFDLHALDHARGGLTFNTRQITLVMAFLVQGRSKNCLPTKHEETYYLNYFHK